VLGRIGGGAAANPLVDVAGLLGEPDRLAAWAEDVGGGGSFDRRGDVQVRGCGEIDRRCQIEPEIDVRIQVEEREHLLVRKVDRVLSLDLVH
jgi:hypothetical protein